VTKSAGIRVASVLSLIAAEAFLYGFTYPYFSLALNERAVPLWLIGLNASLASAGILIAGPFLPRLIDAMGLRQLVVAQFTVSLTCFVVLLFTDNLIVWFTSRFIMGTCFASLWTTTEIWLNGISPEEHRGRIIGASGTLYAFFQFVGPLVLGRTGAIGPIPIIAAIIPLALSIVVALSVGSSVGEVEDDEPDGNLSALMSALPIAAPLMAVAFLTGIGETAMQSLLPLYGRHHGLDVPAASFLVAVFSLGEAVLVMVLGWLADRSGRRSTLLLCTAVAAVSTALVPLVINLHSLLWVVLFFAGGTIAGLYTLGVVLIGYDFRGQKLVVVSTGFAMAYSAGSVIGATPVAAAMERFGFETLPVGAAGMFASLFVAISCSRWRGNDADRT
jgi:MFS family permease